MDEGGGRWRKKARERKTNTPSLFTVPVPVPPEQWTSKTGDGIDDLTT